MHIDGPVIVIQSKIKLAYNAVTDCPFNMEIIVSCEVQAESSKI